MKNITINELMGHEGFTVDGGFIVKDYDKSRNLLIVERTEWNEKIDELEPTGTTTLWTIEDMQHQLREEDGQNYKILINNLLWYAVQADAEDNDWGTGSYSLEEAKKMVIDNNYYRIAVIQCDECIQEILREDF